MTDVQKKRIDELHFACGIGYRKIAGILSVSADSVKGYLKMKKSKEVKNNELSNHCMHCGKKIESIPRKRKRKYCLRECYFKARFRKGGKE